jgi:hypothetical protein
MSQFDKLKEDFSRGQLNITNESNYKVTQLAFQMLSIKAQLCETFPEHQPDKKLKLISKRQNQLFYVGFRNVLRELVDISSVAIKYPKGNKPPNTKDIEIINRVNSYLNKPYGSYNLRDLTDVAQEYYEMLHRHGIILISLFRVDKNSIEEIIRG